MGGGNAGADAASKGVGMTLPGHGRAEWLEADGLGGFASGTTSGVRTRRYHALLLPCLLYTSPSPRDS